MDVLAVIGLIIVIAVGDFLLCIFGAFMTDLDIENDMDEFMLIAGVLNTVFFILTLTFTICKLGLGM